MQDYTEQIEDYIFDRLEGQTKLAFEQAMEVNPSLAEEVNIQLQAKAASADLLELELRSLLEQESNINDSDQRENSKLWWIIGGLLLLTIVGLVFNQLRTITIEKPTYASLYTEPTWPIERSTENKSLSEGISQALSSDFRQGITTIHQSNTEANLKYYWLAELFAQQQQPDSTLFYTSKVIGLANKRDRLNYLNILAHYHLNDYEQVQSLIDALPQDTDEWYLERYELISR